MVQRGIYSSFIQLTNKVLFFHSKYLQDLIHICTACEVAALQVGNPSKLTQLRCSCGDFGYTRRGKLLLLFIYTVSGYIITATGKESTKCWVRGIHFVIIYWFAICHSQC